MDVGLQAIIGLALMAIGIVVGALISLIKEPYDDFIGFAVILIVAYLTGRFL